MSEKPRTRHSILLICILGLFGFLWWVSTVVLRSEIWSVASDHASLPLSQAFNLDHRLQYGDFGVVGYAQYNHPGVPLQILSWTIWKIVLVLGGGGSDPIRYTLENPANFWVAFQLAALLLTFMSLILIWRLGLRVSEVYLAAALLVYFSFRPAWTYGLFILGSETFAPLLGAVILGAAGRALGGHDNLRVWVALGVLSGITWLVKLNFVVIPAAIVVGGIIQIVVGNLTLRHFVVRTAAFLFASLITAGTIGWLVLGSEGFLNALRYQKTLILHTGTYGKGTTGLVDLNHSLDVLRTIGARIDLWLMTAILLGISAVILFQHRRDQSWLKANLPVVGCLIFAVCLGYAAVIKHFGVSAYYYLLPASAVLPMLVLWLGRVGGQGLGYAVLTIVTSLVAVAGTGYFQERLLDVNRASSLQSEIQAIYRLPLSDGELRLWSYRVNAAPYLANATAEVSLVPESYKVTRVMLPQDIIYDIWGDWNSLVRDHGKLTSAERVAWRYAIFDRQYVPTFASLPAYFQQNGVELGGFDNVLVVSRSTRQ